MLTTDNTKSNQNVDINSEMTRSCGGLSADICGQAIERGTPDCDLALINPKQQTPYSLSAEHDTPNSLLCIHCKATESQ